MSSNAVYCLLTNDEEVTTTDSTSQQLEAVNSGLIRSSFLF